jgi:hypothetical protein
MSQIVTPRNITTKFREAFEAYTPGDRWIESLAPGDIISIEGNAAAASYLNLSKSPLLPGVTTLTSKLSFNMPFELAVGLHMSQRTLGQEFAIEAISTEETLPTPADLAISAIQHAASVLTITTTLPHNLRPGMRFGVRDCADSRFNYPALVVASIPTTSQFTATAGPGGTIPSITAGPFATGYVFTRSALGLATNGTSLLFENATVTNASYYVRSESGDALPSGTILGNHAITCATTASVQAIAAALTYAFQPTNEFRLTQFIDGIQWSDVGVDALGTSTNRYKRTQVVPDIEHMYRFRFRATNNASLSRPVAQIVTAVKTGTTTATITTDVPHGLTTSDLVAVYGIRAQGATEFPNLLTATAVASTPTTTSFTIVIGTAGTVTSYGGYVARVNGGNLPSAIGASAVIAQSIVRTNNILTVTGNTTWTGLLIGDMVNLVGCRNNTDGATLGIDGAYRVRDVVTTALTLEPINATVSPTGADILSTNCGGAIIKRTCLRISYVRILDFERQRVEMLSRPATDISNAVPVSIKSSVAISGAVTLGAGTALVGDVGVNYRSTASGASATHIVSAATTNAANLKAAAGKVLGWALANTTASWRYVKLHNLATAPTAGAAVARTIAIPPNGLAQWFSEGGITFATGIGITTVTGAADTDATAVALNDIVGELIWV